MRGLLRAFRDMPLRQKLILSYCIVIILPLSVLGVYSYGSANEDLKRQLNTSAVTAANQLSSELGYRFERQEYPIKSIVFNPKVINAVTNREIDVYQFAVEMNEDVEPIFWNYLFFMSEMKEIVIYSENRQSPFGNFIQPASLVQEAKWYKETVFDTATRWWSDGEKLFATRNIYEPGQSIRQGILYIEFDFDRLINEVIWKVGGDDRIAIESHTGDSIFSTFKQDEGESAAGGDYLSYRRGISDSGWSMFYYASTSHIGERTEDILKATFVMIVICVAVLFVIVLLFSRTLLHGLMKLNERMKRVEEGELDIMVSAASKDEIGQLTNRFGHMLRQINVLIEEAYVNRIARKEAELVALQEQIKPHFLYNSLSLINSQAIGKGAFEVSRTVTLLAKFYRTALNKGREQISVRDEITMVQTYVEIQQIMSGHAFEVVYELDEAIFRHAMIRMILQPLVENAIDHGLKEKLEGERLLTLKGYKDGEDLVFEIRDTGVGIEEDELMRLLSEHSPGYGLRNVRERIRLSFGEPYGVSLASEVDKGTTVTVRMPLNADASL
jgi:two-component system sensor histidine kinase YesM